MLYMQEKSGTDNQNIRDFFSYQNNHTWAWMYNKYKCFEKDKCCDCGNTRVFHRLYTTYTPRLISCLPDHTHSTYLIGRASVPLLPLSRMLFILYPTQHTALQDPARMSPQRCPSSPHSPLCPVELGTYISQFFNLTPPLD